MINIYTVSKIAFVFALLILSSCASYRSQVACPSFDGNKNGITKSYKRTLNLSGVVEVFSFKNRSKSKDLREEARFNTNEIGLYLDTIFVNPTKLAKDDSSILLATSKSLVESGSAKTYPNEAQVLVGLETSYLNSFASAIDDTSMARVTQKTLYDGVSADIYPNVIQLTKDVNVQKDKKASIITENPNVQKQKFRSTKVAAYKDVDDKTRSKRKLAILKGVTLLLMAIIAFISVPVLGSLPASIGLVAILLLDILISLGLIKYYQEEKPKLAKVTGFLRLLFSAIFGIGIGYHIAGNVLMFNTFWQLGLIGFGLHLIALGILFNNEGGKKWVSIVIKSLLILAGIQYIFINAGILLLPNLIVFEALKKSIFILPMILGEVSFAFWMIFKGGKKVN